MKLEIKNPPNKLKIKMKIAEVNIALARKALNAETSIFFAFEQANTGGIGVHVLANEGIKPMHLDAVAVAMEALIKKYAASFVEEPKGIH